MSPGVISPAEPASVPSVRVPPQAPRTRLSPTLAPKGLLTSWRVLHREKASGQVTLCRSQGWAAEKQLRLEGRGEQSGWVLKESDSDHIYNAETRPLACNPSLYLCFSIFLYLRLDHFFPSSLPFFPYYCSIFFHSRFLKSKTTCVFFFCFFVVFLPAMVA